MSTAVELGMVTIQLVKAMVQALQSIAKSLESLADDAAYFRRHWRVP